MAFKISGESGGSYESDAQRCVIPTAILEHVLSGDSRPRISGLRMNGNKITYDLESGKSSPHRGFSDESAIKALGGYGLPLTMSYKANGDGSKGVLSLSVNPKQRNNFVFSSKNGGFHEILNGIFCTREWERLSYDRMTLEKMGLAHSDALNISLSYETPHFIWRSLPEELFEHVYSFELKGPFVSIGVRPNERDPDKLEVLVGKGESGTFSSHRDVPGMESTEVEEVFKDKLVRTGYFRHLTEEGTMGPRESYLVKDKGVISKEGLQVLEDIARTTFPGVVVEPRNLGGSEISFRGNVSRNAFFQIPKIFDESGECRVKGYVEGGNITIKTGKNEKDVDVILSESTLEDAEKLIRVGSSGGFWEGALGGSKLTMEISRPNTVEIPKSYKITESV